MTMACASKAPPSPSQLLSLPTELQLQILSETSYPSLFVLQRTHPVFRNLIVPAALRSQLLAAEHSNEIPRRRYVCYVCVRVLPRSCFSDNSRRTPKGIAGKDAHKRFCISCGVKDNRYTPGQAVVVDGISGVICRVCRKVLRTPDQMPVSSTMEPKGHEGFCGGHATMEGKDENPNLELSWKDLDCLIATKRARMGRARHRNLGMDDLSLDDYSSDYSYDSSEDDFTSEYNWEAFGVDWECLT